MVHASSRRHRGTIIAYFLILISALTTGLLTTMALSAGEQSRVAGVTLKRDQCFYAAEAGVQNAFWMLQTNPNWRATPDTPLTCNLGNVTYSVTCTGGWDNPCLITSVGTIKGAANGTTTSMSVTAAASPTVVVPAISLGGNFDNGGNVTINGDVQTTGSISTNGDVKETGSLYAGGTIGLSGSVAISGTSNPNTSGITQPTINIAALKAAATQVINVPAGGMQVTSLTLGQGGIIYFKGGPITFKGQNVVSGFGTIVTDKAVTIQNGSAVGSSNTPANLNIVSGGDLNISGYLGLIGSVYVNGNITKNGGLDVTGTLMASGDLSTSGGFNVTRAQPPTWDPRSAVPPGSMALSRIVGPIF